MDKNQRIGTSAKSPEIQSSANSLILFIYLLGSKLKLVEDNA